MFCVAFKLKLANLNYNFECDWPIELSDNKLSNNNLASELVENRSLFKPITIEEIVNFMISNLITFNATKQAWTNFLFKITEHVEFNLIS